MQEEKSKIELNPSNNEVSISFDESNPLSDETADTAILKDIMERKEMMPAVERLEIIKNLRARAGMETEQFLEHQSLEYKETNPSSYGVTLGIEIEIPQASVLPNEAMSWSQEKKAEFYKEQREKYKETKEMGVPNDPHGPLWEFAELPVQNPLTLAREVQALIHLGLIDVNFGKFPLHVNIGGITLKHCPSKKREDARVLIRALDASGWCTDSDRILMPYNRAKQSWYRKGESGILERESDDAFVHDKEDTIKTILEYRTPQVQTLSGLDRYLQSSYYLGSALRAYQNTDEKDPISKKLANVWKNFADTCTDTFKEYGIESPRKIWKMDPLNPNENSPFQDLAKLLDKAKNEPKSRKAQFVHDVRLLIIQARGEAKKIIEEDREKRFPKE